LKKNQEPKNKFQEPNTKNRKTNTENKYRKQIPKTNAKNQNANTRNQAPKNKYEEPRIKKTNTENKYKEPKRKCQKPISNVQLARLFVTLILRFEIWFPCIRCPGQKGWLYTLARRLTAV
jgi:hypothetical protein